MNYANPQEHVPEVERSIRVIKERFRVAFHRLPFKRIPKIMIKILAMECTKKLNFLINVRIVQMFEKTNWIFFQVFLTSKFKHLSALLRDAVRNFKVRR